MRNTSHPFHYVSPTTGELTFNPLWWCTFVRNLKIAARAKLNGVRTWPEDEERGAA